MIKNRIQLLLTDMKSRKRDYKRTDNILNIEKLELPAGSFVSPSDVNRIGGGLDPNQLNHFIQLRETDIYSCLKGLFITLFIGCLKRDIVPARRKSLRVCLDHMHIAITGFL